MFGEYLQCYLVTIAYHLRRSRPNAERARELAHFFFLFGYETKEPKWGVVPFPLLLDKIRGRDMKGIDDDK